MHAGWEPLRASYPRMRKTRRSMHAGASSPCCRHHCQPPPWKRNGAGRSTARKGCFPGPSSRSGSMPRVLGVVRQAAAGGQALCAPARGRAGRASGQAARKRRGRLSARRRASHVTASRSTIVPPHPKHGACSTFARAARQGQCSMACGSAGASALLYCACEGNLLDVKVQGHLASKNTWTGKQFRVGSLAEGCEFAPHTNFFDDRALHSWLRWHCMSRQSCKMSRSPSF
jgi:hypothetical protein